MAANINDLITSVRSGSTNAPVTTVASARSIAGTSLVCDDLTGWPTDTAIHFQTYKKNAAGTKDFSTAVDMKGIVSSNTIGSIVIENGTDAGNDVGDYVELAPTGAWVQDLHDGLTAEHNVDGTHADVTATSVTTTGAVTAGSGLTMSGGSLSLTGINSGWTGAGETWTYSSYDSTNKTGVITVPTDATTKYSAGMRVRFTNNSATQYGIITAVASTTLTVYFGTDYSLTNSAITVPHYSVHKAPFGFPLDPTKWTVKVTNTSTTLTNITAVNTAVNDKSISLTVPIGAWTLSFSGHLRKGLTATGSIDPYGGLSTANNTFSDSELVASIFLDQESGASWGAHVEKSKSVSVSSATVYYLNVAVVGGGGSVTTGFYGSVETTVVKAVCAYL